MPGAGGRRRGAEHRPERAALRSAVRQPVEFPLYVSSTLLTTQPGEMVAVDPEQMTALPPIRTVLQAGKKAAGAESVQVTLHARLTEIGTLELWCSQQDGPQTWKLQFDVRAATAPTWLVT